MLKEDIDTNRNKRLDWMINGEDVKEMRIVHKEIRKLFLWV